LRALAFATALCAIAGLPAGADTLPETIASGRDLDAVCHNNRIEPVVRCIAFIDEVRRGRLSPATMTPQTYCVPDDVSKGKLSRVVEAWVRARPDRFDEKAEVLVSEALYQSYPCGSAAARP
jgi:hypothetical protein